MKHLPQIYVPIPTTPPPTYKPLPSFPNLKSIPPPNLHHIIHVPAEKLALQLETYFFLKSRLKNSRLYLLAILTDESNMLMY